MWNPFRQRKELPLGVQFGVLVGLWLAWFVAIVGTKIREASLAADHYQFWYDGEIYSILYFGLPGALALADLAFLVVFAQAAKLRGEDRSLYLIIVFLLISELVPVCWSLMGFNYVIRE